MQSVSANYQRLTSNPDRQFETRLVIDGVGTFDDSTIVSISTNIAMFQKSPAVGKAVAGEIDISMLNPATEIPMMARLRLYVQTRGTVGKSSSVTINGENLTSQYAVVADENIDFSNDPSASVSGESLVFAVDSTEFVTSEWIPQGVFFVDTRKVTANSNGLDILTIHGYDAILKAEQEYSSNEAVGGDYDTAYVSAIASAIGVPVDERTWDIMQGGHLLTFPLGYTMREILGYIAGIYVGCFIITDEGKLRLVSLLTLPIETNLLVDEVGDVLVFGSDSILI